MFSSIYILVLKLIGNALNIITGDTLVADRHVWLSQNLPETNNNENFLDIGCGSGAFTFMAAKRGYRALGCSWDEVNQKKAEVRCSALKLNDRCEFQIADARELDTYEFNNEKFDYILNFENIEHIIDDKKLFIDIEKHLKPGGFLLLTTPYLNFVKMSKGDIGPFSCTEDGSHMRRGYSDQMLIELCDLSGLKVQKIEYCSGFVSQKVTYLHRKIQKIFGIYVSWVLIMPLRPIVYFFELIRKRERGYSICLVAYKPRFL
jgi:SAM-dependent methyltransferase